MGLFRDFVNQTRKPEGGLGKMMLKTMNSGHAKMADWGLSHLKLRNFVKEGQKLPLFGIGPYLIYGIGLLTAICIVLFVYVFKIGNVNGNPVWLFRVIGAILIILGFIIWFVGALKSGMDENITENKLKTDGIYAWVRNPMYSGWWICLTGISLMWHNICMIPVFFINWGIMTIILKNTEEKWLAELYGSEYEAYKRRVNRCIPWKSLHD